jgi:hypothetical protein
MAIPARPSSIVKPATPVAPANQQSRNAVSFQQVTKNKHGHRIVLYGPGGIGKTTLACQVAGNSAFVDADESLAKLKPQLEAAGIKVPVLIPAGDWASLRIALQSSGYDSIQNVILDTWAPIELWCVRNTLQMTPKDGGKAASNIEDYGFGKGYRHLYDTFLKLVGDLDAHIRAGRNVIIVAHDETNKVPNPAGQDFIRWEPKMQHTPNASIRLRMKEWADHVLFFSYDIDVAEAGTDKGKAKGVGYRTLHTAELPHFMAKSRTTSADYPIEHGRSPWAEILK